MARNIFTVKYRKLFYRFFMTERTKLMKRSLGTKILTLCLALFVFVAALPLGAISTLAAEVQPRAEVQPAAQTLTGYAHSATNSYGDVFLGGQYMEIGISTHGSFGSASTPPLRQGILQQQTDRYADRR